MMSIKENLLVFLNFMNYLKRTALNVQNLPF